MSDIIEKTGNTLIQHGHDSERIYLMKLGRGEAEVVIGVLEDMARENGYTKIIAKIPESAVQSFERAGYRREAMIPSFYCGTEAAFFMAKYLVQPRSIERNAEAIQQVLIAAGDKTGQGSAHELAAGLTWDVARESDAEEIGSVYRRVFASYPFPIHDVEYIVETMSQNVVYFCVRENGRIVSVASSEMDEPAENVEMTDFATLPDYRGRGCAVFLLDKMEKAMSDRGMKTAYTIARALSHGMNIAFAKMGYQYAGTLTNNTQIAGRVESMNIWYKHLHDELPSERKRRRLSSRPRRC